MWAFGSFRNYLLCSIQCLSSQALDHIWGIPSPLRMNAIFARTHMYGERIQTILTLTPRSLSPHPKKIRVALLTWCCARRLCAFSVAIFSDTFASKVAAIQDKYADASVGNVTGSNAVNVFLGIGVAWTIGNFAFSSDEYSYLLLLRIRAPCIGKNTNGNVQASSPAAPVKLSFYPTSNRK